MPNTGRMFGRSINRLVSVSTRLHTIWTLVSLKLDYPSFWVIFCFAVVLGNPPLLVSSRSGFTRRLVIGTTSGIHVRWWHRSNSFSWEFMSSARPHVTFFYVPLVLFQPSSLSAPGSFFFTLVCYSPGILPGPRPVFPQT